MSLRRSGVAGACALLALVGACTAPHVTATAPARSASAKPGINDPYKKDVKVEEWVARFETESREIFHHRHAIVDALDLPRGGAVADIGAGTGLFSELFAERVGPDGTVTAVDIAPEFLEHIRKRCVERGLTNVRTVRCREDSVDLPPGSVDVAFVCDTYHHFEYPRSTLASIHRALRPGGRLVIIDFIREPGVSRQWILDHVRAGMNEVIAEIEAAGFVRLPAPDPAPPLAENYFLQFAKRD